jgi:DnaJ-domain-containing protein 1
MTPDPEEIRRLLTLLATYPVLPPTDALPTTDEGFRALLAELARGERSAHLGLLEAVAAERTLPVEELVRRTRFLLACLVVPEAGTHYEVLGVPATATTPEIRARWASLIQLYHPDHVGGEHDWLDDQARRLIEAYQTLKDPERRRAYDAQLEPEVGEAPRPEAVPSVPQPRPAGRSRWRWAPVGILVGGIAVVWAYLHVPPSPLPVAPAPPSPRLLDTWSAPGSLGVRPEAPRSAGPRPIPPASQTEPPGSLARRDPGSPAPAAPTPVVPALPHAASQASEGPGETSAGHMAYAGQVPPPPPPPSLPAPEPAARAPATAPLVVLPPRVSEPIARAPSRPPAPSEASPASSPGATAPPARSPGAAHSDAPVTAAAPSAVPSTAAAVRGGFHEGPLALVEAFRGAYERKDLPALMELLGAEPRERNVIGRTALEQLYARNLAALERISYEITELNVQRMPGTGDVVVQGQFRIRARQRAGTAGQAMDVSGPIRWTVRSEGGVLRIVGIDYQLVPQ